MSECLRRTVRGHRRDRGKFGLEADASPNISALDACTILLCRPRLSHNALTAVITRRSPSPVTSAVSMGCCHDSATDETLARLYTSSGWA